MCVLWQSDLRGLVAFFFYLPRFVGSLRRGDKRDNVDIVDKKKCAYLHRLAHSKSKKKINKFINYYIYAKKFLVVTARS